MAKSQKQQDVLYWRAASPTSGSDQVVRSVPGLALLLVCSRRRRRRRWWKLGPLLVAHGVDERSHLRLRRVHFVEERVDFSGGEHGTTASQLTDEEWTGKTSAGGGIQLTFSRWAWPVSKWHQRCLWGWSFLSQQSTRLIFESYHIYRMFPDNQTARVKKKKIALYFLLHCSEALISVYFNTRRAAFMVCLE